MINFARKYYQILTIMVVAALIAACGSGKEDHLSSSSDPDVYYSHSVAFLDSALYTWGANTYGQLGNGDDDPTNNRYTPVQVVGVNKSGYLTGMAGISAGGTHILAFNNTPGNVYAWGNNGDGQLGNNSGKSTSTPVMVISDKTTNPVTLLSGVTAVSAGGSHSLALKTDGTVWAWGSNDDGKLGVATTDNPQLTAVQVTSLTTAVTKVAAAGGGHSLALMNDKTVMSWGRNTSGQLGVNSSASPITTPGTVVKETGDLTNVIDIAAGRSHSLFLLENGTVWSCGYNSVGQLGDGSTTNRIYAVQVVGLTGIAAQIAAGFDHSLALMSDGTVWAWGLNNYGQLGNGAPLTGSTLQKSTFPVQVVFKNEFNVILDPPPNIEKIVAIGNHNLAVDGIGQLWVWGYNSYGELGVEDDDATNRNYATPVPGFPNDWGL
jgi:alpha-tubulin suppressor-like RCC1 family protein